MGKAISKMVGVCKLFVIKFIIKKKGFVKNKGAKTPRKVSVNTPITFRNPSLASTPVTLSSGYSGSSYADSTYTSSTSSDNSIPAPIRYLPRLAWLDSPSPKGFSRRRRGLSDKSAHLGQILRVEILGFTEDERNGLLQRSSEVRAFLALDMGRETLEEAAAKLSDEAVIEILFANASTGERLIPYLPIRRQYAVAYRLRQIYEWNDHSEKKSSILSCKADEIKSCLLSHVERLNGKESVEALGQHFPTIYSDSAHTQVTITNLPDSCVVLAHGTQEYIQTQETPGSLSVIDTSTIRFDHLTRGQFYRLQALQLSLSMVPSLPSL
jgi:hypothetical protein